MLPKKSFFSCFKNQTIAIFACALALPFLLAQPASGQHRKRVAIISAYHESAPWVQNLFISLTVSLADRSDIVLDPVYMNASLITDSATYNRTVDGVFQHFERKKPDYAIMIGGMGITLRDRIKEEWGNIPFILVSKTGFYGPPLYYFTNKTPLYPIEQLHPIEELRNQYNFTFIEHPDLENLTIDMMLQMQPSIRKILMLADASYHNRHVALEAQSYLENNYPDIEYEWLVSSEENVPDLQAYLTNYNPEIGLLLCAWFYDRKGLLGNREIITGGVNLIPAVEQPVFTLRENYLTDGVGAVGGYFPDIQQIQNALTSATLKMLNGVPMKSIPFLYEKDLRKHPIVNYPLLKENHLAKDLCPEGTIFINKPHTFWDKYKVPFIIGCIMLFVIAIFIAFRFLLQKRQLKIFQRYNTLLSNMPIGYTQGKIIFSKGKVADLDYHSSNQFFLDLLDENAIPGSPNKLFPSPYIAAQVSKLLQDDLPCLFSYHFKRTDRYYTFLLCLVKDETGSSLNINPSAKKKDYNVDLFAIDVTERNRAEKDLRSLTDKLGLTLQLTHIFPWEWNLALHEINCDIYSLRNSTSANRHRPKSVLTLKDSSFLKRVHPDDKEKVRDCYNSLLQGKEAYISTEFRVSSPRGKTEWFEINAIVTEKDEVGQPLIIEGSLLVITDRKQQEQDLIDARTQAQESDRMKSAFLANMSHEIRTPLNAIVGFSGLLAKTHDEEKKRKFVDLIESNNGLLLQLISDVLDLAKVESNTLEFYYQPVDLNELMRKIEESIRFKVKEGVTLHCFTGLESCVIEAEPNRLAQLINNLLTNSCKFTTEGYIEFGYELQGKNLYFYVKDTGIGISFENQQKLFQRFSKLNTFAQGTGLGLSICKGIVEKMGGCIGAVSPGEGKGSKFWFTIPYKPTAVQQEEEEHQSVVPEIAENGEKITTILVAEDNESNYMLFQTILEEDYTLLHAWDGEQAVDLYKRHKPQLILMDIGMPNMDGYEAVKEIRKISSTVPIIAVTAYAFASDKAHILASGFSGYIAKPIREANLMEELESVLGKKKKD